MTVSRKYPINADMNCLFKVKFNDGNQKDLFFSSLDHLCDITDREA